MHTMTIVNTNSPRLLSSAQIKLICIIFTHRNLNFVFFGIIFCLSLSFMVIVLWPSSSRSWREASCVNGVRCSVRAFLGDIELYKGRRALNGKG